ncbi:hypothetical protein [Actinomyces vulturis]|uniref:hypothetical protein n=1 Tax=Actinomyces vulturis TaxID=1857645 RepID=UPI00082C7734|nr:hypothetical protein [Actinomyces vulturis]
MIFVYNVPANKRTKIVANVQALYEIKAVYNRSTREYAIGPATVERNGTVCWRGKQPTKRQVKDLIGLMMNDDILPDNIFEIYEQVG